MDFTPEQRRRTTLISSFSAFVVIAISALMGLHILNFFGSIAVVPLRNG